MFRKFNRALAASLALGLGSVGLGAPADAAADCPVLAAPVVESFAMTPAALTAPSGDGVEHSTLSAQVDACGAETLAVRVQVTSPAGQTQPLEDFGPSGAAAGSFGADLTWRTGDVGQWTFALVAETVDPEGVAQQASATLPFTVEAPTPPPPAPPAPVVTAPTAPRALRVAARTATGGTLTWQAPASVGGAAITAYRIVKPGADVVLSGAARSYAVRGLQPAHTYAVSVQARNSKGYGPRSTVMLRTTATVPGAVRAVRVAQRGTTSGRVSWQAPVTNGGSTITGYRIVKPGADVTVKATARSYLVKGLRPGQRYTVQVAARNAFGAGASSAVTLGTLSAPPAKPRSLAVSKLTRTSAKVSWQAPVSNGGSAITGYRIIKPGSDVTVGAGARSYTVKGLKAGHRYTVKIQARNARGYGSSAAARFTTTKASTGGRNCTPGYSPCLAPASDYDCAGGSGNGPRYAVGPVYVTGSDPYDLDRDGDGVACEW